MSKIINATGVPATLEQKNFGLLDISPEGMGRIAFFQKWIRVPSNREMADAIEGIIEVILNELETMGAIDHDSRDFRIAINPPAFMAEPLRRALWNINFRPVFPVTGTMLATVSDPHYPELSGKVVQFSTHVGWYNPCPLDDR